MFVDLHIHSCLSPCADDDMTPANICGMAHLKGLDAIAVTDHNTGRNLPYVKEAADYYGLILLPGMEITTKEEVHLLGYFRDVETAVAVGEIFSSHLPPMKNKPVNLGLFPEEPDFPVVEVRPELPVNEKLIAGKKRLWSSDAHHLGGILEAVSELEPERFSLGGLFEFINAQ